MKASYDGTTLDFDCEGATYSVREMYRATALAMRTLIKDQHAELTALRAEVERLREERALWRHRLRIASAKMDGQHTWRLSSSDWPPLVGSNPDEVVRNALAAIRTQPMPAPPVEEE